MNVEHLRAVLDAIAADHQKQRPAKILQRIGDAYTQTFQSPNPETAKAYEDIEEVLKTAITLSAPFRLETFPESLVQNYRHRATA